MQTVRNPNILFEFSVNAYTYPSLSLHVEGYLLSVNWHLPEKFGELENNY